MFAFEDKNVTNIGRAIYSHFTCQVSLWEFKPVAIDTQHSNEQNGYTLLRDTNNGFFKR